MPAKYGSEKRTIGELLSTTSPLLHVPEWQRNFSWSTTEVETFWLDLVAFSNRYPVDTIQAEEYFLGSVVLVHGAESSILLDGQQRLATATILLSVIARYLKLDYTDAATRTRQKWIVDTDDATQSSRYKLTLNRYDRNYFREAIQDLPENERPTQPKLKSHKAIWSAWMFFDAQLAAKYEELGGGRPAFEWALRVRRVLTDHMSVVIVRSEDEDNAAAVFETLNDRGIRLSTSDLLRNLVMRKANDNQLAEMADAWEDILAVTEAAKLEDFIRHYWLSHFGDIKTRRLYHEIKPYIESGNIQPIELVRSLRDASAIYMDILNADTEDAESNEHLRTLDLLGAKPLRPACLSALQSLELKQARRVLGALVVLYVRHNLIGQLENSRLESAVYRVASELRTSTSSQDAIASLREAAPDDEEFQAAFQAASLDRSKPARYILRMLEMAKRTTEELQVEALPDRVNLEHIYPKSPSEGRFEEHSDWVNRIGNLTLLAKRLNQKLKNASFPPKKETYGASQLVITSELANLDQWSEADIETRQEAFSRLAVDVWSFPE